MLYFRFVTNAFVLGVVEAKLGEVGCIVKGKRILGGIQYSLRCIGQIDGNMRGTRCRRA
jgi:hypothetical protein